jgi:nucleoside-diphosphate-sugar epimerase
VARALLAGREAECTAGLHRRDFLHTDDLADALITLLGSAVTGPVNVASGLDVPIRKIVELIADACGRPDLVRLGARPTPAGEPPLLTADVSRLRDEVGWSPKIDLAEGLKSTAAWWRVQPSLPAAA